MGCILIRIPMTQVYESCKKEAILQHILQYRVELENRLDQWLRRAGEGYCDGGAMSAFEMEIFLYAHSPRSVIHGIRRLLNEHHLFDAVISFEAVKV